MLKYNKEEPKSMSNIKSCRRIRQGDNFLICEGDVEMCTDQQIWSLSHTKSNIFEYILLLWKLIPKYSSRRVDILTLIKYVSCFDTRITNFVIFSIPRRRRTENSINLWLELKSETLKLLRFSDNHNHRLCVKLEMPFSVRWLSNWTNYDYYALLYSLWTMQSRQVFVSCGIIKW